MSGKNFVCGNDYIKAKIHLSNHLLKFILLIFCVFFSVFFYKKSYSIDENKNTNSNTFTNPNPNIFDAAMVTPKAKKHPHFKHNYLVSKDYHSKKEGKALKISYEKFKLILTNEFFPQSSINKMWCIAKNESSFNPLAYNYNKNGSFDVGLFQINQTWKDWCGMKDRDLLEVKNNAHCALLVLKKQGYTAWVTFKKFCR